MSQNESKKDFQILWHQYRLLDTVGTGGFAKVKKAVHSITNQKVAIKIMDKQALGSDLPRVYNEIEALKQFNHAYIAKLYQVIETDNKIFLVQEFCEGGELFDYIVDRTYLKEDEARKFYRQLLSAIGYIHSKGYCHRDLKPENILLTEGGTSIKLIDFGLCKKTNAPDPQDPKKLVKVLLKSACGSPAYAAPELLNGRSYEGELVDIWSSGVILYALRIYFWSLFGAFLELVRPLVWPLV